MGFIMTIFAIVGVGVGIGLALGIAYALPLFIYTLPYSAWLGWHKGTKGIPRKLPSESLSAAKNLWHSAKNATKLYRSWITHTPHNITNW